MKREIKNQEIFYQIGKRDMLAEMFMMFRNDFNKNKNPDLNRFLVYMAKLYQTCYDNHKDINPQVQWFLDNFNDK